MDECDTVLVHVAKLQSATPCANDTICRFGGDVFVVVASSATVANVDRRARKIEDTVRELFLLAGRLNGVSTSLGFSVFPEQGNSARRLGSLPETWGTP